MAQAMIDLRTKLKKNVSTQTQESIDFFFKFTNYKSARIYHSKSYKDYVLSLNLGHSKKFIITKSMWKKFNIYYPFIDSVLNHGK